MAETFTLSLGGLQVRWESPGKDGVVLALQGDMDNLSVPVVREALDAIYATGCFMIVLDLHELAFTDSSGLGAMVGAWRRCQREGGHLTVINPSGSVRRLMDMTGISKLLFPAA